MGNRGCPDETSSTPQNPAILEALETRHFFTVGTGAIGFAAQDPQGNTLDINDLEIHTAEFVVRASDDGLVHIEDVRVELRNFGVARSDGTLTYLQPTLNLGVQGQFEPKVSDDGRRLEGHVSSHLLADYDLRDANGFIYPYFFHRIETPTVRVALELNSQNQLIGELEIQSPGTLWSEFGVSARDLEIYLNGAGALSRVRE